MTGLTGLIEMMRRVMEALAPPSATKRRMLEA
jgi:hypothetical protein